MRVRGLIAAASVVALSVGGGLLPAEAEPVGGDNVGVSPLSGRPGSMPQTDNTIFALGYAGGVLYLGGTFTEVRPAGAAPHTQVTSQARLAAVNATTGRLISTWTPDVTGGSIFAMSVSPDKSRLYVGGTFNRIDGISKNKIAAFDLTNPSAPALLSAGQFGGNVNGKVAALASTNDAVYAGGYFNSARGVARSKVAAFARNGGAVLPWQVSLAGTSNTTFYPQPFVTALETDGNGRVAIGGMFDRVNGVTRHGLGLVDGVTGASVPGFNPPVIQPLSYVVALQFDAGRLFYSGRDDKSGTRARLEGVAAVDATTGRALWGTDFHRCLGDTFALKVLHGQVWAGTHAHDCSPIGTYPEARPRFYGAVLGQDLASGEQVHFYPSLFGNNTEAGSLNNVRALESDGTRLFVAGGWLRVNGVAQQNLLTYDLKAGSGGATPTKVAKPTATSAQVGARVTWRTSEDIDDKVLTYRIYRGQSGTPVGEVTAASAFWNRPMLTFHDSTVRAGASVAYRVQVFDASNSPGKSVLSNSVVAGTRPAP